ncbi:MAG: hypothetical protein LUO89_09305 [Methanothrix sp.]|nr:hypothetical protein [Methanothrix sp.]
MDYLWHLIGVKSAGVDVNFDLTLQNMVLNETRPVATDAHLTFTNSFTGQPTNAPIAVPRVTASAFLGLGVTTDQVSYPANTPVNITGAVNNTSTAGVLDGSVKFEVYGADNILVGVVGTFPFSALAAGAQTSLTGTWNTGTVAAGGYYVLASLYDAQNRLAGTAQSAFTVTSVPGGASPGYTGIGGTIAVDRPAYQPFDRVQLANRISNLTQNLGYSGLVAVDTVYRPDGTVLWTQTAGLQPLLAASFIDLPQNLQLATAPAGRYQVVLSVRNASGVEVARAVSGFSVLSTADTGAGLKGTLGALPKIVSQSDPVVINWTALNQGNADFAALPLKLTIIDPASKQIMVQQPYSIALLQGKTYQTAFTWDTSPASVGSTYLAILSATVGGKDIALAQDTFLVTYPPVKLGVTQSSVRNNRVLVWAACNAAEVADKAEGQPKAEGMNGDPHGNAQAMADKDHPESIPACLQTRAAYLDTLLTQLKVPHLITTNRADFKKAFREGRYNVYWLSGGIKLEQSEGGHDAARKERTQGGEGRKQDGKSRQGEVREHGEDNLAEELREAVNRGDSVILDGIKGGESLQEAAGVAYDGQPGADTKGGPSGGEHQAASFPVTGLPFIRQPVTQLTTLGDLFAAQTLSANGQAQKMRLSTGKSQADFLLPPEEAAHDHPDGNRDGQPNAGESQNAGDKAAGSGKATGGGDRNKAQDTPHPADGRHAEEPKPVWPAIVANGYGKGRVLTFGFDLVDTLQNGAAPATWQTLLQNGLGWLLPPLPVPYSGGALVTLETGIQNQARAVDLGVTTLLPAGSTLLQTLPQAVLDANGQPAWAFTLPQAGSQTLQSTLRLPPVTGNHKALTTIDSIKNGVRRRYGEYSYYWQVAASDTLADKIAADLKALVLTARKEQDARSAMLSGLQRAQAQLGRAQYAEAIETQLRVIGQLRRIASVDTGAIRLDLDRLLQQTEWDWLRTGGDKPAPEARHDERPGAQHDERAGEHPGESQDNSRARRAARGQPPQND